MASTPGIQRELLSLSVDLAEVAARED
jgi:hypothetical protein